MQKNYPTLSDPKTTTSQGMLKKDLLGDASNHLVWLRPLAVDQRPGNVVDKDEAGPTGSGRFVRVGAK